MSEQATSEQIEQASADDARQCSGCHRRNAQLTLFENGKLYCSTCAGNVSRLGIEPVVRAERVEAPIEQTKPAALAAPAVSVAPAEQAAPVATVVDAVANTVTASVDEHEHEDEATHDEEREMASQPVQPDEIAVMPSLAMSSVETPSMARPATPSGEVSLHAVLQAERARLLERRGALERQFRADVEAIDVRLTHVESLLGDAADSLAS